MDFYMKLPRNKKEFTLFIAIVSIISVNIIAPLITCLELGFSMRVWGSAIKALPLIWLSVIALVLLTYAPAELMTKRIVAKGDSFNAHIVVNILSTVFLMSIFLTVIGTWIGSGSVSMEPFHKFFYRWPRNFAISFGVESLVAQPIARAAMLSRHRRIDAIVNS